jgi:subtilisin family serine protease
VHAYVIDTGILTTHKDFAGRASHGWDFIDNDADATDCEGHGTHVAGTIAGTAHGVAKEAKVVGVRVLSCEGRGTTETVIAGFNWVTENAVLPAVANASLGGGADPALDEAVKNTIAAGITVALAAGNENADACNSSPARVPTAITVGASTRTDARADFSNYGSCVDIFAPGKEITSLGITDDNATATHNGTSMASPHVAGVAALILEKNPKFTPEQVAKAMVGQATGDKITNPGTGSPNTLLYAGEGSPDNGTPPSSSSSAPPVGGGITGCQSGAPGLPGFRPGLPNPSIDPSTKPSCGPAGR